MTRHQLERIYGMRELTRILTLTPRRTAQLRRLELLHGESGYTFRDLLALKTGTTPIPLEQVESVEAVLSRFDSAGMSLTPGTSKRTSTPSFAAARNACT